MTALKERATVIDALGTSLSYGGQALTAVPELLRRVLEEESWREFVTRLGEHVAHDRWGDFVVEPPLAGLGATTDLLRRVVGNDAELLSLLDEAERSGPGRPPKTAVNHHHKPEGKQRDLRRLRKDRPDLHAQVVAGELSAHRAAVVAGFRRPTVTVPVSDPERLAAALRRNVDPDVLKEAVERLMNATS
jgi:hypothetical protein